MADRPIEETETALLDWMGQTGGTMRQALDQFGVKDQLTRNQILARNLERTAGMGPGGAYETAQAVESQPSQPLVQFQPGMSPEEWKQYALQQARLEAGAMPGGMERNIAEVAPAPEVQRQAMIQEKAAQGMLPEQARQAAYESRPDLRPSKAPPPRPVKGKFLRVPETTQQVSASYSGIPGGGGGRLGDLQTQYGEQAEKLQEAIEKGGKGLEEALEEQERAINKQRLAAQLQAAGEKQVIQERQQAFEELQAQQAQEEARRQEMIQEDMYRLQSSIQDLKQAKVDPTRWFKHEDGSKNYGKTILASVAVALGAIGEGFQGRGGNPVLSIIERAIDQDIAAQRENLANRRAGVGLEMNMLGQMRAQFGDERQAETAARLMMLQAYEMKLDEVAARTKDPAIEARYAQQKADLETKKAELVGQFERESAVNAMQATAQQYGMETQRQQLGLQRAQLSMARQAAQARAAAGEPAPPPGLVRADPEYVPTEKDKEKAQKMRSAYGMVMRELDQLIDWRDYYGHEILDREAIKQGNTLLNRLKSKMRKLDETGARIDPGEIEMMGLPENINDLGYIKKQLETLRGSIIEGTSAGMEPYGYALDYGRPIGGGVAGEKKEPQR